MVQRSIQENGCVFVEATGAEPMCQKHNRFLEPTSKGLVCPDASKTKQFDKKHWADMALLSQTACNAMGLLHSMVECLREWRADNPGDSNGAECVPLRFMTFQFCFLTRFLSGADYPEKYSYHEDHETLTRMAKGLP